MNKLSGWCMLLYVLMWGSSGGEGGVRVGA